VLDVATPQTSKAALWSNQWLLGFDVNHEGVADSVDAHHEAYWKLVDDFRSALEVRHVKVGGELHAEWLFAKRGMRRDCAENLFQLLKVIRNHWLTRDVWARNVELNSSDSLQRVTRDNNPR
jgi:hypothetical protein